MPSQVYPKYITVTGPIASGKTTLGSKIAAELGYVFIPEDFEDNPFLAKYNAGEGGFYDAEMWFPERDFSRHQRAQLQQIPFFFPPHRTMIPSRTYDIL